MHEASGGKTRTLVGRQQVVEGVQTQRPRQNVADRGLARAGLAREHREEVLRPTDVEVEHRVLIVASNLLHGPDERIGQLASPELRGPDAADGLREPFATAPVIVLSPGVERPHEGLGHQLAVGSVRALTDSFRLLEKLRVQVFEPAVILATLLKHPVQLEKLLDHVLLCIQKTGREGLPPELRVELLLAYLETGVLASELVPLAFLHSDVFAERLLLGLQALDPHAHESLCGDLVDQLVTDRHARDHGVNHGVVAGPDLVEHEVRDMLLHLLLVLQAAHHVSGAGKATGRHVRLHVLEGLGRLEPVPDVGGTHSRLLKKAPEQIRVTPDVDRNRIHEGRLRAAHAHVHGLAGTLPPDVLANLLDLVGLDPEGGHEPLVDGAGERDVVLTAVVSLQAQRTVETVLVLEQHELVGNLHLAFQILRIRHADGNHRRGEVDAV